MMHPPAHHGVVSLLVVAAIGLGVGFLSGLLGKGGSAIASPLLHLAGVPALVALAAPLPATIPSTMAAGSAYARRGFVDWRTVRWTVAIGVPATIVGAIATRWIDGSSLIAATDVVLIALGVRLALRRHTPEAPAAVDMAAITTSRIVLVAVVVGLASGLLANSGGFLLAPLYLAVLHRPIKAALATSLAVGVDAGDPRSRGAHRARPRRLAHRRGARRHERAAVVPRRTRRVAHRCANASSAATAWRSPRSAPCSWCCSRSLCQEDRRQASCFLTQTSDQPPATAGMIDTV